MLDQQHWQTLFRDWLIEHCASDPAHDLQHIERVVSNARKICEAEQADWNIVFPAAWLHDCVHVPKDSPDRTKASRIAADRAASILEESGYPSKDFDAIHHAVVAHSFSAKITPETLEAKVLQDADRLDAVGAIGLCRCLMLGGHMDKPLLSDEDPFCKEREPDDSKYVIDHCYAKLLTLENTMTTDSGRAIAQQRTDLLRNFLRDLEAETT
jgi:uncharacterized protein